MSTESQANSTQQPIVFMAGGQRQEMPEEQAMQMLASMAQHDTQKALGLYLTLTNANPHAQNLLRDFYQVLLDFYMFEELLELTSKRLQALPNCYISFSSKLDALQHMFRNQEVIDTLRPVVERNANDPISRNILGSFLKNEGQFEEARRCFDEAIACHPDYAPPYWNRSDLSIDAGTDLAVLRDLIASGAVPDAEEHYLHFAAYRLAEKQSLYDEAFEHLQIANGMKRRQVNYDLDSEIQIDRAAESIFTRAFLDQFTPQPISGLRPIFIMGMPRSGTTLVEQILASHSEVAGGDEYTALANAVMRAQRVSSFRGPVDQWLASRDSRDWQRIAKTYEANMRFVRGDKQIFTDKNQFNHRSIGIIKAGMANAKILFVERNPMDVAFGCYRQLFNANGARFSYDFTEIARMYASYNQLMQHWETVTDGMIMRVQYEDLVRDTNRTVDSILRFCDLTPEAACLQPHTAARTVKTLSALQVRQPIFTHGIERWKRYEKQLQPLRNELVKAGVIDSA